MRASLTGLGGLVPWPAKGLGGGAFGVEGEEAIDDRILEGGQGSLLGFGMRRGEGWNLGQEIGPAVGGEHGTIHFQVKLAEVENLRIIALGILELVVGLS